MTLTYLYRILPLLLTILSACNTNQQKIASNENIYDYRADIQIKIGNTTFDGTGSSSLLGPLTLAITSPISMDLLKVTTCAREDIIHNAGKAYTYVYTPTPYEMAGPCPAYVSAVSKDANSAWFFLGLKSTEDMPAHVYCNGQGWTFSGMTVCQSKQGLTQTMSFAKPVTTYRAETQCHAVTTDNQNFTITPDLGFCRMSFALKEGDKVSWHRAVYIGYKSGLMR